MTDCSKNRICDEESFEGFQRRVIDNCPDKQNGLQPTTNSKNREKKDKLQDDADTKSLITVMINENKRRDYMLERLFTQVMTTHSNASTTSNDRNSTYQIMPDLSKSILTFDGEGDSKKAQEWLRRLEAMQQLHHCTDSLVLETAKANLRGGAVYWLERQSSSIKKWEDFVSAYKKTFIHTESLPIKWKKMAGRVQQRHESTSAYFHEKVKYCWDVGLTLEDTKEHILIGMWNRKKSIERKDKHTLETRPGKKEENCNYTPNDIKKSIERKDKHTLETRPGKKEENCNYTPNADMGKPENKTRKHPYTRLPPRNEEGKPLCFVCKRYEHVSKYFRQNIQNQQNTASKRENAPESSETLVTSSREEDKEGNLNREEDKEGNLKYFKEALINGKPIQAYVDQDSKCVLLRRSEAERLNLKYQPIQQNFIIKGYGSGEVKPLGKLEAYVEVDEAKAVTEVK
ncbi:hypothetical protein QE152_g13152 [Popillia japonica]|uniref:Retrotransposon gag domain-containing protein n=1 Tax=Popillia japonica TaxID=7064 RepID=A0AAW1LF20_POPJA